MATKRIFDQILHNLDTVIAQDSPLGVLLWQGFVKLHPADIAQFLGNNTKDTAQLIFVRLPTHLKLMVFSYLSDSMKVFCLSFLDDQDRGHLLASLPLDELTDFFDELSDEELKKYLVLLHKKDREKVLSLMQFNPESAGGIMDTNVLTLMQDFTVEKSIQILQRLQPNRELHREIYVTNQENELVGHINLEDLVLKHPKTRLSSILSKNELVVQVDEDREAIAHKMVHYQLMTVPVINHQGIFLGIIPSDTLVSIIEEEAAEDVYKISALKPIKGTYFDTPFKNLFLQRIAILIPLLLLQTFSTMIMLHYETLLEGFLFAFSPMITSTGGNSSSQTSALVIQGMTLGEINESNMPRFLWREFNMAGIMGITLGIVAFIRIYLTHGAHNLLGNFAVSLSLAIIVIISVMLGSVIPFLLKKLKWDPALAAGPFLATLMDVIGLFSYCYISKLILK
ncbi:magnesium transporter [Candidatus Dependentiae bacterium]|nr:magnesium transporter [Candidatus Dependentiae bacterium]